MHVYSTDLFDDNGKMIASGFSSHWAACAAMIRLSDPTFKSTGGDRPDDLEIEKGIGSETCMACNGTGVEYGETCVTCGGL